MKPVKKISQKLNKIGPKVAKKKMGWNSSKINLKLEWKMPKYAQIITEIGPNKWTKNTFKNGGKLVETYRNWP